MQAAALVPRLHQFNHYHQRWLADSVLEEEEKSCNQWLLHQSPDVTTVKEAEEYRPERVRYRYTTTATKVQSEWSGGVIGVLFCAVQNDTVMIPCRNNVLSCVLEPRAYLETCCTRYCCASIN